MRKVEVHSYSEKWMHIYMEEAEKLKVIFGNEILAIYHIGSTAVPGLKAKPIIDIMPVVNDLNNVDNYNLAMQAIGYVPKGENGIVQRRYFQKGGDNRTHHVHIYQVGSSEITRHLAFRDYLIAHPDEMRSYGTLKQKLAHQFPYDINSYINGKESCVKDIERKALEWYKEAEVR
ncbi:GrpB family protein [Lysinibacillus sp. NPDC097195]|uniref:GrpB family protein n=1 Tax=Lysinibacillus sp. NPDC097195 TaxID=3364141 RepID=UPI0038210C80